MSDKVVIEGVLCSWQSSDLHVGISINGPSLQGDWTPLSGQRVRVTVDLVPEPEPRCPFCGGEVTTALLWCGSKTWLVNCCECDAKAEAPTKEAALDALAEWLDVCPRCGGRAEYKNDWYMIPGEEGRIRYWHWAICTDKKCGIRSLQCDSKAAAAQWWNKREGRK